jgi:hypothetical protein
LFWTPHSVTFEDERGYWNLTAGSSEDTHRHHLQPNSDASAEFIKKHIHRLQSPISPTGWKLLVPKDRQNRKKGLHPLLKRLSFSPAVLAASSLFKLRGELCKEKSHRAREAGEATKVLEERIT